MLRARLNMKAEVEPPGIYPFLEASPDSADPGLDSWEFPLVDGSAVPDETPTRPFFDLAFTAGFMTKRRRGS